MTLLTTTIGAYPKPDYVALPDWFRCGGPSTADPTGAASAYLAHADPELEEALVRATHEVVREQVACGIDIPTDGEIRRDNYIHYHCRHLDGFDFARLDEKVMRGGAWTARVPTIVAPVVPRERGFLARDWRIAQEATDKPVKITLPGPMTIADTTLDQHYGDERALGHALAEALAVEIEALGEAGCRWIQVDEPVLARYPAKALDFGVENLDRCFARAPAGVVRTVHMCCGYPDRLDQEDFPKADRGAYFDLADALEQTSVAAVSIEDAHRHNDLGLLERFRHIRVILGVVAIAKSRVESVEEIAERLTQALEHIEPERLIAAPDCGLGMLDRATVRAKLSNLASAAHALG